MEDIIRIPTAEQVRNSVQKKVDERCGRVWKDILITVQNSIDHAIRNCSNKTVIYEEAMRGVPTHIVYKKLKPILTGMGYKVSLSDHMANIYISWSDE